MFVYGLIMGFLGTFDSGSNGFFNSPPTTLGPASTSRPAAGGGIAADGGRARQSMAAYPYGGEGDWVKMGPIGTIHPSFWTPLILDFA